MFHSKQQKQRRSSHLDAIYARQSVEKIGSLSIAGQIKLCRAKSSGEPLVYQDQGFSGKNTNRPKSAA